MTGYVKNLADGTVEVVVEGEAADVDALLRRVRRGPSGGRVDKVDERDQPVTGRWRDFSVAW